MHPQKHIGPAGSVSLGQLPSCFTLDPNGAASVMTATIDDGSNDACGLAGLTLSKSAFACTDAGRNTVQLTATDHSGNQHACSATVSVRKRASQIVLGGAATGQYSDPVPLRATLTDAVTGGGLAGRAVLFTVGARSASATTGGNGVALAPASLTAGEAGGSVAVGAGFAGDCTYTASNAADTSIR